MFEESEINVRALLFVLLFIGAITFFVYPIITKIPDDSYKDASGNIVKIPEGWVRAQNGTPVPLVYPTVEIRTEYIYITPTPDNGIYYASEEQNGTRKMGRYFVFNRPNATGYKTLSFHSTVYGFKELPRYHFWNLQDNSYYEVNPPEGKKYLFIFVQTYSDDVIGDDVRNYLPNELHYMLDYKGELIAPIPFTKEVRIYELENTYNLNDDYRVQYYGQFVSSPLTGKDAGKQISIPYEYIMGGKQNAIDGYIVYEIDSNANINDIKVNGDFFGYGYSQWILHI